MSRVKLQKQHLKLVEQNFNLLDDDADKKLNRRQVCLLFRALGQTISNKDLNANVDEAFRSFAPKPPEGAAKPSADAEAEELLDFDGFVRMFESCYRPPLSHDIVIEGMQLFDTQRSGKQARSLAGKKEEARSPGRLSQ